MAKYLTNSSGTIAEASTVASSAGAGDSGKIPGLNGSGVLDNSFLPPGIGADTAAITASEALSAGDLVNIHNSSGPKVRKADASTSGKEAHGFVLAAVSNGASATVYFEGTNNQVSSLTAGVLYLSDTTPGGTTSTAPSGSGKVVQRVGFATATTALNFDAGPAIVLV